MTERRLLSFMVSALDFLTSREKILLSETIDTVRGLRRLQMRDLRAIVGRMTRAENVDWEDTLNRVEMLHRRLTSDRIVLTFYDEASYPPQLREIHDPPFALYWRGKLPDYDFPSVGVVGTRRPTGAGLKGAFSLGFSLASAGLCVVSGLARGIDAAGHEGCVAAGGRSVAVLGSGIDRVYPAGHAALASRIIGRGGCLVSEYPPGTPPLRHHFPARNRIISGLCRTVVIVQAPARSGALITADFAAEQNRDVLVHAAGLAGAASAGTKDLAESGAGVIFGASGIFSAWEGTVPGIGNDRETSFDVLEGGPPSRGLALELSGRAVRFGSTYFMRGDYGRRRAVSA